MCGFLMMTLNGRVRMAQTLIGLTFALMGLILLELWMEVTALRLALLCTQMVALAINLFTLSLALRMRDQVVKLGVEMGLP